MTCAACSLTPTTSPAASFNKSIIQKWSLNNGGVLFYKKPASSILTRPCAASSSSSSSATTKKQRKKKKKKDEEEEEEEEEKDESRSGDDESSSSMMKRLDDVNPVGLGRKSRQIFDEVWRKFSGLGQISRTIRSDEDDEAVGGPMCEFAIPGAQNTTVLVVGATSRVGRVVVRKLMLRGYNVKVRLGIWISFEILDLIK